MITFICFIAALVVFSLLAFFRASLTGWGLGVVLTVFFIAIAASLPDQTLFIMGITLGIIFALLGIPALRRTLISTPLFRRLQRNHSPLDESQMGVGGWEASLFNGHPDWRAWLALPKASLPPSETRFIEQEVAEFCALLDASGDTLSPEAQALLPNFAQVLQGEHAFSAQAQSVIIRKIAAHNRSVARLLHDASPLLQAARELGELNRDAPTTAERMAYTYLLDAAQQMTALAVDLHTASPTTLAMMQQQAHDGVQYVLNQLRDCSPRSHLRESLPSHLGSELIFEQGALRFHPYLFSEISALQLRNAQLAPLKFDVALRGHIRHTLSNIARTGLFGLTGGIGMLVVGGHQTTRYYQRLTRFSAAFALCTDAIIVLQNTQAAKRLGEIFSLMYVCAAALKRFEDDNRPKADLPALSWAMQHAQYRIQQLFSELLQNLPHPFLRTLLKKLIFPLGCSLAPPSDRLSAEVVAEPSRTKAARKPAHFPSTIAGISRTSRISSAGLASAVITSCFVTVFTPGRGGSGARGTNGPRPTRSRRPWRSTISACCSISTSRTPSSSSPTRRVSAFFAYSTDASECSGRAARSVPSSVKGRGSVGVVTSVTVTRPEKPKSCSRRAPSTVAAREDDAIKVKANGLMDRRQSNAFATANTA